MTSRRQLFLKALQWMDVLPCSRSKEVRAAGLGPILQAGAPSLAGRALSKTERIGGASSQLSSTRDGVIGRWAKLLSPAELSTGPAADGIRDAWDLTQMLRELSKPKLFLLSSMTSRQD